MPPFEADVAAHAARFIAMLDAAFKTYGIAAGLPPSLRDAVQATPRHRFVHRFRLGGGSLLDFDADPAAHLATVYSDTVMRHVDAGGMPLPSTNSKPGYILWLLHMLGLQPGQRVLEIGSGSGWLTAIMAQIVGPEGHVTGIEIIPELAARSQADLAALGLENVTILAGDGTAGAAEGLSFDKVIITAATWDFPAVLFEQVVEGGCALVPIELRGTDCCQVTLLRRVGARFEAERSVVGWFVPLVGAGQQRAAVHRALDSLPFWAEAAAAPGMRFKLPLGASPGADGPIAKAFWAFFARSDPHFTIFETRGMTDREAPATAFGLVEADAHSVALYMAGELVGYGGQAAVQRLDRAFTRWVELGSPEMADFGLEVWRRQAAPAGTDWRWVEVRNETTLVWNIRRHAAACRPLLGAPETSDDAG